MPTALRASRMFAAAGSAAALVVMLASPASAHMEVVPAAIPPGKDATIKVKVKSEFDSPTNKFELILPLEEALDLVAVAQPIPGWKITPREIALPQSPARKEAGHTKTSGIGSILWSATGANKGIAKGETFEFPVSLANVPATGERLVFRGVQTYADDKVVRWFDVPATPEAKVFHPAAVVPLSDSAPQPGAGGHGGHGGAAATTTTPTAAATTDAVAAPDEAATETDTLSLTSAPVMGGLGALGGLVLGLVAGLLLGRRRSSAHSG